jgi:hypothetical protein
LGAQWPESLAALVAALPTREGMLAEEFIEQLDVRLVADTDNDPECAP